MDQTPPKETRPPVNLRIKFRSESVEQFIERYAVDVSRGGIFIRTREPLAVGTHLKLDFQFQNGSPLMSGDGTVVWIREFDPNRTTVPPGMGVRFDKLTPESQTVLEQLLTEKSKRERGGVPGSTGGTGGMAVRRPSSMFSVLEPQVSVKEGGVEDKSSPTPTSTSAPTLAPAPIATAAGESGKTESGGYRPLGTARNPFTMSPLAPLSASDGEATGPHPSRHPTPADGSAPFDDISDEPTQIAAKLPSFLTSDEEAAIATKRAEDAAAAKKISDPTAETATERAGAPSPISAGIARVVELHGHAAAAERRTAPAMDARPIAPSTEPSPPPPARDTVKETAPAGAAATAGPATATAAVTATATAARSAKRKSPAALVGVTVVVLGAAAIFLTRFFGSQATQSAPTANSSAGATVSADPGAPPPTPPAAAVPTPPPAPANNAAPPPAQPPSTAMEPAQAAVPAPTEPPHPTPPTTVEVTGHGPATASGGETSATGSAHKAVKRKPRGARDTGDEAAGVAVMPPEGIPTTPAATTAPTKAAAPAGSAPAPAAQGQGTAAAPADTSAAAESDHQIHVTSKPVGADVALDGQTVGKTPYSGVIQDVNAPHFIAVRKDGFEPFEQMISASSAWSKVKTAKGKPTGAQILKITAKLKQVAGSAPEGKPGTEPAPVSADSPAKAEGAKPDRPLPPSDDTAKDSPP